MYRSQYDTDVTTFSPEGRIHQVEYAMEAVKQGSAVVGIRTPSFAILAAYRRQANELCASHQRKLFQIGDHCGIGISGLVADARVLSKYMRQETLNHKYVYGSSMPVERLVLKVADKSQVFTQKNQGRPYGLGMLVIGQDATGPHLFETSPSGMYFEWKAHAFGARSQSARTYLEKNYAEFADLDKAALIKHALTAIKATIADGELTSANATVAIVGKDTPFTILEEAGVDEYVDAVNAEGGDDDDDDDDAPAPAGDEKGPAPADSPASAEDADGDVQMK